MKLFWTALRPELPWSGPLGVKSAATLSNDPGPFPDPPSLGCEGSPSAAACLAVLLGGDAEGSLQRAHGILARVPLLSLRGEPAQALHKELGLEWNEALRLEAALYLAGHLRLQRQARRPAMQSARQVYRHLGARLGTLQRETLQVLLLDGKHRLMRQVTVSVGTLTSSLVHPREVFRPAIRHAAAALILVHNHPSGDPEPSLEDIRVTRRILETGSLLGIPLLDHVIIGCGCFASLRERVSLPWSKRE